MSQEQINEVELLRDKFPHGHPSFIPLLLNMMELHSQKNLGYAKGGEALGNFYRVSAIKKLYPGLDWSTPLGVCLGNMLKQLDCALWQLAQDYQDKNEPVGKRLADVLVYAGLGIILEVEGK